MNEQIEKMETEKFFATTDTCIKCGEVIPEGRQVCPNCEGDKK